MIRQLQSRDARSGEFSFVGALVVTLLAGAPLLFAPTSGLAQESDPAPSESEEQSESAEEAGAEASESGENGGESSETEQSGGEEATAEGPTPKLSVLPVATASDDVSSIVPERIAELLRDRLGGEAGVDLLPSFEDAQKRKAGASGSSVIRKAREKYRSGNGLANAGKFEQASEPLSEAIEMLRENLAELEQFSVYTDALLKLAWSHWNIDHNYDARKSMREFAHLKPEAELDEEKYPEKLLEVYRNEVKKIEEAGTGTVVINSKPEGGTVWVDGEKRGEAPVRLDDVGFGYHYAVVEGPKGGRVAEQLRIRGGGKEQTFTLKVETDAKAEEDADGSSEEPELPAFYTELTSAIDGGAFGTSELEPYLTELAKRTDADFVAWVVMVKGETEYTAAPFVYRIEDGRLVRGDDVTFTLQLSNLRVGVRKLATSIVESVESMPESGAVESVALGAEPEGASEPTPSGQQETGETKTAQAGEQGSGSESEQTETDGESVEPPPSPEPSDSSGGGNRTWTYVGIGGAAAVVGGLVAGGVLLMNNQQQQPDGFSATVTW